MVRKFPGKRPILLNFRKFYLTENLGNSGMKVKWNRNCQDKIFENLSIPHEVVLFFGIYANYNFLLSGS